MKEVVIRKFPTAFPSIGCKETVDYLLQIRDIPTSGRQEFLDYLQLFQAHTRQFAKRQISWFKNSQATSYIWMEPCSTKSQVYPEKQNMGVQQGPQEVEEQIAELINLINSSREEYEKELASPGRIYTKDKLSLLRKEEQQVMKGYISVPTLLTPPIILSEVYKAMMLTRE
jgi:hypothetical protein